ncbi:MAG: hypothetical protein WBB37_12070 [bacterium]
MKKCTKPNSFEETLSIKIFTHSVNINSCSHCLLCIFFICTMLFVLGCGKEDEPLYVNISQSAGASHTPAIAVGNNDELYVVWADSTPGNLEIFFSETTNNGMWSQGINISNNTSISACPFIDVDNLGNIHICWWDLESDSYDSKISYRMRSATNSWANIEILAFSSAPDSAHELPRIICDKDNNVYVMWTCRGELRYKIKSSTGIWSEIMVVPYAPTSNPAELATDLQGNLHLTWEGGNNDILYQMRIPDGTWQNLATITQGVSSPLIPDITVDNTGIVYITWTARDNDLNRYVYYSDNKAGNWAEPEKLPMQDIDDQGWYSTITSENGGTVHFIWENWTQDTAGNYGNADIYYAKKYSDNIWSEVHNISNTAGKSICDAGSIADDIFGNIHIVWADNDLGNFEVFYLKIPVDSL